MSHPDMKTVVISVNADPYYDGTKPEHEKALQDFLDAVSKEQLLYTDQEAMRLGISIADMDKIVYLRSRSRWTQEKEDHLISLAREGKALPNVYAGEDDE